MNKPAIIITGAAGFIGNELVRHFVQRQYKVYALCKTLPVDIIKGVSYHQYNLESPVIPIDIFANADYIVHCAYLPYTLQQKDADKINYEGTKRLYDFAQKHQLKKFVYLSSFSAHPNAISHYGKSKFLCETIFDAKKDLILKPGLVLGNGGLFKAMQDMLSANKFIPILGNGKQSVQPVFIDELSKVIQKGIEENISGIYPVGSAKAVSMKMLYKTIGEMTGQKNTFVPLPYWCAESLIFLAGLFHFKLPITKENIRGLKRTQQYDIAETMKVFQMQFMNYKEALAEAIKSKE